MRIHTDLPYAVVTNIARAVRDLPGVSIESSTIHTSRSRKHAIELRLSGSSSRNSQGTDYRAATWDEWGAVLAAVFAADEHATCVAYDGAEHFDWATGSRFVNGLPKDTHRQHRWAYAGVAVTGTYAVSECTKCSALTRRMARNLAFAELSA